MKNLGGLSFLFATFFIAAGCVAASAASTRDDFYGSVIGRQVAGRPPMNTYGVAPTRNQAFSAANRLSPADPEDPPTSTLATSTSAAHMTQIIAENQKALLKLQNEISTILGKLEEERESSQNASLGSAGKSGKIHLEIRLKRPEQNDENDENDECPSDKGAQIEYATVTNPIPVVNLTPSADQDSMAFGEQMVQQTKAQAAIEERTATVLPNMQPKSPAEVANEALHKIARLNAQAAQIKMERKILHKTIGNGLP